MTTDTRPNHSTDHATEWVQLRYLGPSQCGGISTTGDCLNIDTCNGKHCGKPNNRGRLDDNMTMIEIMQRDCPHAIKGVLVMPDGMNIPVIGSVGGDGTHDIDPAALDLLQRAGTT